MDKKRQESLGLQERKVEKNLHQKNEGRENSPLSQLNPRLLSSDTLSPLYAVKALNVRWREDSTKISFPFCLLVVHSQRAFQRFSAVIKIFCVEMCLVFEWKNYIKCNLFQLNYDLRLKVWILLFKKNHKGHTSHSKNI